MIKPSCSKARRLVLESEGGRIESADALWLETHIRECATCREESRELATLFEAWKSMDPPRLTAGRLERIEQAVIDADVTPIEKRRPVRTWKVPTIAAGIAATIAVVSLALFWAKRQAPASTPTKHAVATRVAPPPQTASITKGTVHVYGPTGEAQLYRSGSAAPWNATLHTPTNAGSVVALGPHATLGIAASTQLALRHHGSDTIIAVSRGTVALNVSSPGFQRGGSFRVWIPSRGEVATQSALLVVSQGPHGLRIFKQRGHAQYRWTEGGTPRQAELDDGGRLIHRLELVRLDRGQSPADAAALLAGLNPRIKSHRAPRAPTPAIARTPTVDCTSKRIQQTLARRDAMGALRTLEACRAAGRSTKDLRALEARANLQAGRVRRAFTQYLAVAHSFQGSPAGQTALYSAGRIALRRLAKKSQAKRLFKHYLHTYPKGAHRANVQQMLRAL